MAGFGKDQHLRGLGHATGFEHGFEQRAVIADERLGFIRSKPSIQHPLGSQRRIGQVQQFRGVIFIGDLPAYAP